MKESELNQEIFSRYGAVTRARGSFLYTKKGVRLTDCFQAGGRAILGWGGSDAFTRFKNILNRGLTGSFITEYTSQIDKAVSELLCDARKVYFMRGHSDVSWRPWGENLKKENIVIVPPFPWRDDVYIMATTQNACPDGCITLPPPLVAAITRSIYDLIAALQTRTEKDFFLYDQILTKYFTRKGPYLYPKIAETKYDDFVRFCLDAEIVISPEYNTPSIIPFGADKGVFTKLKNAEFEL